MFFTSIQLVSMKLTKSKSGSELGVICLRGNAPDTKDDQTATFWTAPDVIERATKAGVTKDCFVTVLFDFDQYMRPVISRIAKAGGAA